MDPFSSPYNITQYGSFQFLFHSFTPSYQKSQCGGALDEELSALPSAACVNLAQVTLR